MPGETAANSPDNPNPVRRSGRQPKRTEKLEDFLSSAKRIFRKSAPPCLEGGDPPSQTPTDAETASEASFDGNTEIKAESPDRRTRSGTRKQTQRKPPGRQTRSKVEAVAKEAKGTSSGNEEETKDGPAKIVEENKIETTKDTQTGCDNPRPVDPQTEQGCEKKKDKNDDKVKDETEEEESEKPAVLVKRGPIRTYVNKKRAVKNTTSVKNSAPSNKAATAKENKTRASTTSKAQKEEEIEESTSMSSSSSSDESEDGGYDPNALYCICRQKHNKRFMICCDRCEEWFHGDCVGITEARGRLMERNGEDYVCPNCTAKKNQVVRPATSALPASTDKPKTEMIATTLAAIPSVLPTEKPEQLKGTEPIGHACQTVQASPVAASSPAEEKAADDLGIKGRIEKASNPTGKKKIKIFQPVVQQAAESKAVTPAVASATEQKASSDIEQKVASNVEVDVSAAAEEQVLEKNEDSAAPKCIGPGCEKNAQPDSVYCGSDCILRHAAAAMKSITEPNQKDKAKQQKSKPKSATDGKKRQKADSDEDYSPDSDEDDEEAHAEEQPPHPSTASWSSDHNYIAVTPEKTPSISTVLNKKCMYLIKGFDLMFTPLVFSSIPMAVLYWI